MPDCENSYAEQLIDEAGTYLQLNEFERALELVDQALKVEPENAQAWYYKGCAHSSRNDFNSAIGCYIKSAQFAGDRASLPLYNLGNAYQALGRLEDAKSAFRAAVRIDATMADAWINLGRLLDDGHEHEEAIKCYDIALQFQPQDEVCWCNRGNSYRALRQFETALASYEKALDFSPEGSRNVFNSLVGVASCLGQLGRGAEGVQVLGELLKAGEEPMLLFEKAVILGDLQNYDEAIRAIDRAIALGCSAAPAWNNRAEILAKLNRIDESIASFEKALAADPEFAPAWFGKARVLFNSGQKSGAAIAIEKYFHLSTDTDEVREAALALQALLKTGKDAPLRVKRGRG